MTERESTTKRGFPATVAETLESWVKCFRVVINRGSIDGVVNGDRFVVYGEGPEIKDPETGESLGALEIFRGTGEAMHVQERMATIESDMFVEASESRNIVVSFQSIVTKRMVPFSKVEVGDRVRPI